MYSLVETAKANHVNVHCYLQYLLEEIPKYLDQPNKDFLKDMMPWSEAFHRYESQKDQVDEELWARVFPEPERPRTPRKKDVVFHKSLETQKKEGLSVDCTA